MNINEHDELQAMLEQESEVEQVNAPAPQPTGEDPANFDRAARVNWAQWEVGPNDSFYATGGTTNILPAGVYRVVKTDRGIKFNRIAVLTDKLIDLKDSSSAEIIEGIRTFWKSQHKFQERGILYKRGVLLWGPPGSGKTVTVSMLIKELVSSNGLVLLCEHPELVVFALMQLRRIEPDRPLIVVEEDIEEIMKNYGEHALLALLDGENQINNVVHIATTNYPEELGARIINRPSRFDEVKKIGMPNMEARQAYFEETVGNDLSKQELQKWVAETDGMSIAHLRELVVAIFCLGRGYSDTLERLKKMQIKPKSHEGFGRNGDIGVGNAALKAMKGWVTVTHIDK